MLLFHETEMTSILLKPVVLGYLYQNVTEYNPNLYNQSESLQLIV